MIAYGTILWNDLMKSKDNYKNWSDDHWYDYFSKKQDIIPLNGSDRVKCPLKYETDFHLLKKIQEQTDVTNQRLSVFFHDDFATVIGYNNLHFLLPSVFVETESLKDYDEIKHAELSKIGVLAGNSLMVPDMESKSSLSLKKQDIENELSVLSKKENQIKSGEADELADLKKQMDMLRLEMEKRQNELMADLEKKKSEMQSKLEQFKKELFILDTKLYGLRCYMGEVVHFYTLRDGRTASVDDKLVIHQKIRYLDEELGRYLSLYDFGDHENDKDDFLNILKVNDDLLDILCPGRKSISVVKISRTGLVKDKSLTVENCLENYAMLHDNQLAVMIRNGEQLHIAWLDADRINYSDDNVFFTPKQNSVEAYTEGDIWKQEIVKKQMEKEKQEQISRWFFFAILQGIVDNSSLISLPEKCDIFHSDYVVFNNADGWIDVNLYGSFASMVKRSNHIPLRKGDAVLTGTSIRKGSDDRKWDNTRGIGDRNRTFGLSLPAKQILKVNKVIPGLVVKYHAEIKKVKVVCNPEGVAWYKTETGGLCTYKVSDDAVFDHYEPSYQVEVTDEIVDTKDWKENVSADKWYWCEHSYSNLSEKQLISFSVDKQGYRLVRKYSTGDICCLNSDLKKWYDNGTELLCCDIKGAQIVDFSNHQYYCSIKQHGYNEYGDTNYWVNFQFYLSEVIPLPFLCSTWVKEVIRIGDIGDYYLCGAKMSFADMLPYLKKILSYLNERENNVKNLIVKTVFKNDEKLADEWFENHDNWQIKMTEWQIWKQYHEMTSTRVKSFVKYMNKVYGEKGEF